MCRRDNKDVVIVRVLLGKGHALESVRGGKNDLAVRVISRSGSGGRGGAISFYYLFFLLSLSPFPFPVSLSLSGTLAEIGRAGGGGFSFNFYFIFCFPFPRSPFSKKITTATDPNRAGGKARTARLFFPPLIQTARIVRATT